MEPEARLKVKTCRDIIKAKPNAEERREREREERERERERTEDHGHIPFQTNPNHRVEGAQGEGENGCP